MENAQAYELQISTSNTQFDSNVFLQKEINEEKCQLTSKLANDTTFYWRVRAKKNGLWKDWNLSTVWEFTTDITVFDVQVTVSNKTGGGPIYGAELIIPQAAYRETLAGNTVLLSLNENSYYIFVYKSGYRVRSYVLTIDRDLDITAALTAVDPLAVEYESVSGVFQDSGSPYTQAFNITAGTATASDVILDIQDPAGSFATQSACGSITASAYIGSAHMIQKIAYEPNLALNKGTALSGLTINYPGDGNAIRYFGAKPLAGDLKVRSQSGHLLAQQDSSTDSTGNSISYDFFIDLATADRVRLESIHFSNADTYFNRIDAGNSGGSRDITFESDLPGVSVQARADDYLITVSTISGVDFYEFYVVETVNDIESIPFHGVLLSGNSVSVPKEFIDSSATQVDFYIAAARFPALGYDAAALLGNSLAYTEYSYTESGIAIVQGAGPMSIMALQREIVGTNYRQGSGFYGLLSE